MMAVQKHLRRSIPGICGLMMAVCITASISNAAFAENDACMSLDRNQRWNNEFNSLMANYKAKQYEDALKNADELNKICSRSPALNFSIAQIYHAMGDDAKGLFYIQRATNSTEMFAVKGELLERMWYTRYEMEHPDAAPDNLKKTKKENELLRAEVDELRKLEAERHIRESEDLIAQKNRYKAGLWTGVASAGLGIVLTTLGAALFATNHDDAISFNNEEARAEIKPANYAYAGLIGSGIGLTVIGSALAGFMGYHYIKTQNGNEITMNLSQSGMQLNFVF